MRVISRSTLSRFSTVHPRTKPALDHWLRLTRANSWGSIHEVTSSFAKAKALNGERVRFEISDGFHLIVAFDFAHQIAFVKFVGMHAEHDKINALTVAQF